jgi:hypothetical protein
LHTQRSRHFLYIADAIVCTHGLISRKGLTEALCENREGIDLIPVGDTNAPRKIIQAAHEGFHAARRFGQFPASPRKETKILETIATR